MEAQESTFSHVASAVASVAAGEPQPTNSASALSPHRPFKIIYATLYHDIRPTFVVNITEQFEARFESLMAYKSQFSDQTAGKDIFPARAEIRARIDWMAKLYGAFACGTYAEPFPEEVVG